MPKRPVQSMPEDVHDALRDEGLLPLYEARPFYQRNDYLTWIKRAARDETRQKRLTQMLEELQRDELQRGGVYMGMGHPPSRKT